MNMQLKTINLSRIKLETGFRDNEKDLSLELDISKHGLRMPLIVEKEEDGKYVLVDGYRRFYALKFLQKEDAECYVGGLTSEGERIIKRLSLELHTKKRTSYQLEKMIQWLLQKNYSEKQIASMCNITKETILEYSWI